MIRNDAKQLKAEQRRKEALEKQTIKSREIIKLFLVPRYIHVLNEIFKNEKFSVDTLRKQFDVIDCNTLPEVLRVLDDEAIIFNEDTEGTYEANEMWRIYVMIRLGTKKIENCPEKILNLLLDKGLIYEVDNKKYSVVL